MSKIQGIEISFPSPVSLPDGFEQALCALVEMVCKQYERENPTQVMWAAGIGSKAHWSKADAEFLGKTIDADAPESGEPEWDDSVFTISCAEREDYRGSNPYNPDRDRLQAEWRAERDARKAKRQPFNFHRQESRDEPATTQVRQGTSIGNLRPPQAGVNK